jgi:ATF/CREB family transcription factor
MQGMQQGQMMQQRFVQPPRMGSAGEQENAHYPPKY